MSSTPGSADRDPARRPVALGLAPLGAIVAAFFLPFVESCNRFERPVTFIWRGGWRALWVAPPFVAAALLGLVIVRALARRRVEKTAFALAGLILCAVGDAVWVVVQLAAGWTRGSTWELIYANTCAGALVVAAPIFWLALRRRGWGRLGHCMGAHAFLSAPLAWPVVDQGPPHIGLGGYLYVAALPLSAALWIWSALTPSSARSGSGDESIG